MIALAAPSSRIATAAAADTDAGTDTDADTDAGTGTVQVQVQIVQLQSAQDKYNLDAGKNHPDRTYVCFSASENPWAFAVQYCFVFQIVGCPSWWSHSLQLHASALPSRPEALPQSVERYATRQPLYRPRTRLRGMPTSQQSSEAPAAATWTLVPTRT